MIGQAPYVGIDTNHSALVYKVPQSDDEEFSMRMSLLKKWVIVCCGWYIMWLSIIRFPRIRVHTDLYDAHLYIFKRWVLDMVMDKENIVSISEDLVPMLVKCQYQKKMVEREKVQECKYKWLTNSFLLISFIRCIYEWSFVEDSFFTLYNCIRAYWRWWRWFQESCYNTCLCLSRWFLWSWQHYSQL